MPPFCFVSLLCNSLFQTASQLRTQLQSATKRFLVTYRCIAKRYKALCNARLMQLVPGPAWQGWAGLDFGVGSILGWDRLITMLFQVKDDQIRVCNRNAEGYKARCLQCLDCWCSSFSWGLIMENGVITQKKTSAAFQEIYKKKKKNEIHSISYVT